MFTAEVYKICIASAGGALSEERVAQDTVAKWNVQYGEENGLMYLMVPLSAKADIYVFVIDNYIEAQKVESAIATGAKVLLFFSLYHDQNNTMVSELKSLESFRDKVKNKCSCCGYNGITDFESKLMEQIKKKTNIMNANFYNRVIDFIEQNYGEVIENGLMDDILVSEFTAQVNKLNTYDPSSSEECKHLNDWVDLMVSQMVDCSKDNILTGNPQPVFIKFLALVGQQE